MDNNIVHANLYSVAKRSHSHYRELSVEGREGYDVKFFNHLKMDHDDLNSDSTLITKAGDWGIKRSDKLDPITGESSYCYRIEDAINGGVFLPVEIDSIKDNVKRWYTTNLYQYLGDNVYPLPLNIRLPEDADTYINTSPVKDRLCYANFTMTCPYRIRVAEWAWENRDRCDIDCHFPERYAGQREELKMPILQQDKLSYSEFIAELAGHKFSLCPMGNGLDSFRTWESVLVNTVPIVQDSWMSRVFSKIWPMIIVSRYEISNIGLLMDIFFEKYGEINYDRGLLKPENFEHLLDRIQYESNRLRR